MSGSHAEVVSIANKVYPRLKDIFKLDDVSINRSVARSICNFWVTTGMARRLDATGQRGMNIPRMFEKIKCPM